MTDEIQDPFPEPPAHYEPPIAKRVWFTHIVTGDRGYSVRRDGKDMIRYDRPMIDQVSDPRDWKPMADDVPDFSELQIALVAFEADKKLCWAMGRMDLAQRDWLNQSEAARRKWVADGPAGGSARRVALHAAIRGALK